MNDFHTPWIPRPRALQGLLLSFLRNLFGIHLRDNGIGSVEVLLSLGGKGDGLSTASVTGRQGPGTVLSGAKGMENLQCRN